nr:MAG TPA: Molybdopterin oxidoreductase N-terminal domain [Inoviridae sp.]
MCENPLGRGGFPLSFVLYARARSALTPPSVTTTHWGVFRVPRFRPLKSIRVRNNLGLTKGWGGDKIYVIDNFL